MSINPMKNKTTYVILFKKAWLPVLCLVIGGIAGWQIDSRYFKGTFVFRKIHVADNNYSLISPLLGFDVSSPELQKYADVKSYVTNFINSQIAQKNASSVSVYFRDLESGSWFGVNQNQKYDPASLMKVATMIAYFKYAETDPAILDKAILYRNISLTGQPHDEDNLSPKLKLGNYYTVKQLIDGMIVDSDNIAKDLLIDNIDPNYLGKIFADFGLQSPADLASGSYQISPRQYSLFFRILYNSTYLDDQYSELAMEMLSNASFKNGLVAGIPSDVIAAHKFGETKTYDAAGSLATDNLHDCGIIFSPKNNPYFLCIMTQGYDPDTLSGIIKNISTYVFNSRKAGQ